MKREGEIENMELMAAMTRKDRFFATLERRPVDRPVAWLGIPATSALPRLCSHVHAADLAGLKPAMVGELAQ